MSRRLPALLLGLCLAVLPACASLEAFLATPIGADLLQAVASGVVGIAEQHGLTAAQVNGLATGLAAVDSTEPATMATIASIVQAHMANTPLIAQSTATAFLQAVNLAVGQYSASSKSFSSLQTTSSAFLQAIVVASDPNLATPAVKRAALADTCLPLATDPGRCLMPELVLETPAALPQFKKAAYPFHPVSRLLPEWRVDPPVVP